MLTRARARYDLVSMLGMGGNEHDRIDVWVVQCVLVTFGES